MAIMVLQSARWMKALRGRLRWFWGFVLTVLSLLAVFCFLVSVWMYASNGPEVDELASHLSSDDARNLVLFGYAGVGMASMSALFFLLSALTRQHDRSPSGVFLDAAIEVHKKRLEREWKHECDLERVKWESDREEWKRQKIASIYQQIFDQQRRGILDDPGDDGGDPPKD